MASTITHSTGVITPRAVNGWQSSREARTIMHPVLGRPHDDVTLRPAGLRSGELTLVFPLEADARAAENVFAVAQVLTFADTDRTTLGMSFVVADGEISVDLDDVTRNVWIVTVPFREVLP